MSFDDILLEVSIPFHIFVSDKKYSLWSLYVSRAKTFMEMNEALEAVARKNV